MTGDLVAAGQRLSAWLSGDATGLAHSPELDAVLKGPWLHLEHNAAGDDDIKTQELRRIAALGGAEDRVRHDYRGRYGIELLQNAHDACADAGREGRAWLQVTPSALLVANEGVPFDATRIEALVSLGDSSKRAERVKRQTVGYKGIGFSAVLEVTDAPQIISRDVAFGFDRQLVTQRITAAFGRTPKAVSVRSYPIPLQSDAWSEDREAILALQDQGAVTVIRLPIKSSKRRAAIEGELEASINAESLLFLPALKQISLTTRATERTWTRRKGRATAIPGQVLHVADSQGPTSSWLVRRASARITKEQAAALDDPLWVKVRSVDVAVALPWRNGAPDPHRDPNPMHVYFPTDEQTGRALLVHGDFYVESNRRRIAQQDRGAEVNSIAVEAAAGLAAGMAEDLASFGNDVLLCLAPKQESDGFGRTFAEALDTALEQAAIVLPASQSAPVRPSEVSRLSTMLPLRTLRRLTTLLGTGDDVLRAGDDVGCAEWLQELGMTALRPQQIAARIEPTASESYEGLLGVLAEWFDGLTVLEQRTALPYLTGREILKDTDGNWSRPDELHILTPGVPELPDEIKMPLLAQPASRAGRGFVGALGVDVIDGSRAVELLLDYFEEEWDGEAEPDQALAFLRKLWTQAAGLLRSAHLAGRLAAVPVPVRRLGRLGATGHRRAGEVYAPRDWTGTDTLDRLYGHFQEEEFLAARPPEPPAERKRDLEFYRLLGVATEPRQMPVHSVSFLSPWRRHPEVTQASICPDGHPQSGRLLEGSYLDRLDEVLESENERALLALAQVLVNSPSPLGEEVRISCQSGQHKRARRNSALGYQQWLLTTVPWLPCIGGLSGHSRRTPDEVWSDVPRVAQGVLPQARIPVPEPGKLRMPNAGRPPRDAVRRALVEVHEQVPDLEYAPEGVVEGLDWLLRKLEAALTGRFGVRTEGDGAVTSDVHLPAEVDGKPAWSLRPLVADIDGVDQVPGIAWLPKGSWSGIVKEYGLERASDVIEAHVEAVPTRTVAPLLAKHDRECLLALLVAKGGDLGSLAFRLGQLTEARATLLEVTYSLGSRAWATYPPFQLERIVDSRGARRGGRLTTLVDLQNAELFAMARALGEYLGRPEDEELILSYLIVRGPFVEAHGIVPAQLAEAREALRKYRWERDDHEGERADAWSPEETDAHEEGPELPAGSDVPADALGTVEESEAEESSTDRSPSDAAWDRGRPLPVGSEFGGADVDRSHHDRGLGADEPRRVNASPVDPEVERASMSGVRFGASHQEEARPHRPIRHTGGSPRLGERAGAGTTGDLREEADAALARRATELKAEEVVMRYVVHAWSAEAVRVGHLKQGWDLDVTLPDGGRLVVEVKGFAEVSANVVLTARELEASAREDFRLCVVTGLNGRSGRLYWFDSVDVVLAEDRRQPYEWLVVDWPSAGPTVSQWTA